MTEFMMMVIVMFVYLVPTTSSQRFQDGPVIVGISNDTIAIPLEKPVLMCIAIYGTPTWSRNGTAMTSSIYEQYDFENRTYHMSFLRFCSFNESDEGNYTCSVSNDYDSTKASVNLRMKREFVTVTRTTNESMLICNATGFPPNTSFSWAHNYNNNRSFLPWDENSTALMLSCTEYGSYSCHASFKGLKASHSVELQELLQISSAVPEIEADINDTVVIQCTGSSRTNKNLNISWYRNVTLLSSEWVSRDINGRIVSNLTLERVDRDMFGVYKCTLTYGNCSTAANTTLTPPEIDKGITVTTHVENATALFTNAAATLSCIVHSKHYSVSPDIAWMKNSHPLSSDSKYNVTTWKNGNEKLSILMIYNLNPSDKGEYICLANSTSNDYSESSLYLEIYPSDEVTSIEIIDNEAMTKTEGELYLYVGDKASLNCTGKGGPDAEMTFQWFKNDETLPTNRYIKVDYPNKHSRLSFSGVNRSDVAVYRCRITSGDSVKESNFSLAVGPNYDTVEIAVISEDIITNVDKGIRFTCVSFTHLNFTPEITWIQESTGVALATKNVVCIKKKDFKMGSYMFQQSFLQIKPIKCEHEKTITCNAAVDNNTYNASSSVNLYLKNTIELVVSSIEVHAYVGGDARLVCIAHTPSNASLKIEWFSNNIRLTSQDAYIKEDDFVFKNRRYLMSVYDTCRRSSGLSLKDNSIFECRASEKSDDFNYCGSKADINLVVFELPQLFQIQFFLSSIECEKWKEMMNVKEEIAKQLLKLMRGRCECNLENEIISNSSISCPYESSHFLLYRAQLNGTNSTSVHFLSNYLKEWVASHGKTRILDQLIEARSNCSFNISSFNDGPCPQSFYPKEKSGMKMKPEVISGIALAVAFSFGMLLAVAIIILLRRNADKAIKETIYYYVDTYQYRLYYGADGLYEELDQYEKVDNYQFTPCDAYTKKDKDNSDPYTHYEPTGEDIYAINQCLAYDKSTPSGEENKIYEKIDSDGESKISSDHNDQNDQENRSSDNYSPLSGSPKSYNQYESILGGSKTSLNRNRRGEVVEAICEQEEDDVGYSTVEQTTEL